MQKSSDHRESEVQKLQNRIQDLERKLLEAQAGKDAAQQLALELNALFEALQHPIMVYDQEGVLARTNSSAMELYGFDPTDRHHLENNRSLEVCSPDSGRVDPDEMPVARALRGEVVMPELLKITNPKGQKFTVLGSAYPLRVEGGQKGAVVVWQGITAQEQSEKRLEESERRYRTLFESIDEGFCIVEVLFDEQSNPIDYCFVEANPAFEGQTGLHAAVGKRMRELAPLHEEHWFETYGRIALTGQPERFINHAKQLDNRWYDVYAFRIGQPAERKVAILFQDITASKEAEEAIRESEGMLRLALTAAQAGAWSWDLRTGDIYWSDEYYRIFGFEPGSIRPSVEAGFSRIPTEDLLEVEAVVREAAERGTHIDVVHRVLWPDGSVRWVRGISQAFSDEAGKPERMAGIAIDITEQKQAEFEVESAHRRTAEILESIQDAFYSLDSEGRFTYVNQKAASLWKKQPGELMGKNIWQVFPLGKETEAFRKIQQAMAEGRPSQFETHSKFLNQWLDIHLYPSEHGISVYFQDISERKRLEQELTETTRKLERSNQELEQFAYIASHDLQEPLRKIEEFSKLIGERASQMDDRERDYLERIQKTAGRMRGMVDGLLQLSRINTLGQPFRRVDLAEIVGEVVSNLEYQIRRTGGQVEVGSLPEVEGDPQQLYQLIQNLIGNALKYHRPGQPPVIQVQARQLSDSVQIRVQDNGIGFDADQSELMFMPFKRLVGRSEYEGSGMGLAICRGIVKRHGGKITAEGKPGEGAVFMITLPMNPERSE